MRIAITGNIGCGKSTVAQLLAAQLPAYRLASVDDLVRSLYQTPGYAALLQRLFGSTDRATVSALVFANRELKVTLEQQTMALIQPLLEPLLQEPNLLLEFPLFFETARFAPHFDLVVVLGCSPDVQRERVLARDRISSEKFAQILAQQHTTDLKRWMGDLYIDTGAASDVQEQMIGAVVARTQAADLEARCRRLFCSDDVWRAIRTAYCEPHRAYHGLAHLTALFRSLDPFLDGHPYRDALELAVWFHDFVYATDPARYPDNEGLSAKALWDACVRWAPHLLERTYGFYSQVSLACEFILATKGHTVSSPLLLGNTELKAACELFLDADLAILGQPWPIVEQYDKAIVREWHPAGELVSAAFQAGRPAALESFLARPRLYYSTAFAGLEAPARENLNRLIAHWRAA